MPDQKPPSTRPEPGAALGRTSLLVNAGIVVTGLVVLVVLVVAALVTLVTSGPSGKTGASDAIALITSGGAVLTGLVGAFFGISVAHQSSASAQSTANRFVESALQSQPRTTTTPVPAGDAANLAD